MDFPYGHRNHQQRTEEDSDPNPNPYPNPNSYPPPASDPYGYQAPAPPPGPRYGGGPAEYGRPEYSDDVSHEYGRPERTEHVSQEYGRPERTEHVSQDYGRPERTEHVSQEYGRPERTEHVSNEYGRPERTEHVSQEYGRPDYGPPPPAHHVSHEAGPGGGYGFESPEQQHRRPGFSPSSAPHVGPVGHGDRLGDLLRQPSVRVLTYANEGFSLSIRDGKVVLVPADPRDPYQHWIKDLKFSTRVKDQEGLPSFALVNKATGEAIKHATGAGNPVQLVPYNPDYPDEVLWTESYDTGEGFRCIRMVSNIGLNFDAFHGDEDHGGVRDGTTVVLWEWLKGKNQMWKIVSH